MAMKVPYPLEERKRRYDVNGIARRSNHRRKHETLSQYSDTNPASCACCGENRIEFLVIDHSRNDGAEFRRKHAKEGHGILGGQRLYQWLKNHGYPKDMGLRVLCSNCNSSFGSFGYCPHQAERGEDVEVVVIHPRRTEATRQKILSVAASIHERGEYPSVKKLCRESGFQPSAVIKHRDRLIGLSLWPCPKRQSGQRDYYERHPCPAPKCGLPYSSRGYCKKHSEQMRRLGHILSEKAS